MRVIDAFEQPVQTIALSPDGRYMAATAGTELAVWDWISGECIQFVQIASTTREIAFGPDSSWLALAAQRGPIRLVGVREQKPIPQIAGTFSGGIAVSPNGKTLVATGNGRMGQVTLQCWELPSWKPKAGFPDWSPFSRLAFSRDGEFLAGIGTNLFEVRFASSGGRSGRHRVNYVGEGFFSFSRDSQLVVFGWETDLRVMETRNGNLRPKPVTQPEARKFLDVAFLGSGQLATVDGTPVMRLWSPDSWEITRGYDWNSGGLTCVVSSADGLAGVCGTRTGKLVVFDVDE